MVKNDTRVVWPQKSGREYINLSAQRNAKFRFFLSGLAQPFQRANPFYRKLGKQRKIKNIAVVHYKFPNFTIAACRRLALLLFFNRIQGLQ